MLNKNTIIVKGNEISIVKQNNSDYISLTDMIKSFGDESVMYNWMRNRNTVEFLGIWELINNPDFKPLEFDRFRLESGLNSFVLSNMESINALLIRNGLSQSKRLQQ